MRHVQHPSNNAVLQPPEGAEPGSVGPLPVTLAEFEGQRAMVSFWRPDQEELASLLAGRPVMLYVIGEGHPPVALTVESRHAPAA